MTSLKAQVKKSRKLIKRYNKAKAKGKAMAKAAGVKNWGGGIL